MSKARRITNANDEMDKIDKRLDEAIFDYIVVSQNMSGISPEQFEFAREHILVVFNKTIYKIREGRALLAGRVHPEDIKKALKKQEEDEDSKIPF